MLAKNVQGSWYDRNQRLLSQYDLPDLGMGAASGITYMQYKKLVTVRLQVHGQRELDVLAGQHRAIVPYTNFQTGPNHSLSTLQQSAKPWDVQIGVRSLCRLRCGLLNFAQRGKCVFCERGVRNPAVHVVGACSHWSQARATFLQEASFLDGTPDRIFRLLVSLAPDDNAFAAGIRWCREIDRQLSSSRNKTWKALG